MDSFEENEVTEAELEEKRSRLSAGTKEYVIDDGEDVWNEYLTKEEVGKYHDAGYKVKKITKWSWF